VPAVEVGTPANETPAEAWVVLTFDPADGTLLKIDGDKLFRLNDDSDWENIILPQTKNLTGVVINPEQPATIYLSGVGFGVIRSDDGGINWQTVNSGLPNLDVTALAMHSFRHDTVYAWLEGQGIYRTEDGGKEWVRVPDQGPPDQDVRALAHSTLPGSMNTGWLYASTPTGAYLSMDCF
jgi:photosystem II stability/assembly factor-like uncharacterized protein